MTILEPGIYDGIPEPDYHADPVPAGSLSQSGAKTILRAPALYRWQRDHPVHKDVFDFGTAAHAKVLGKGAPVVVLDFPTWQTNAAKAARDEARAKGETPLLVKDALIVDEMATALLEHRLASMLLAKGEPEVSAFAPDPATGVMRRGRVDWLSRHVITDYKTAATADPAAFGRSAAAYGYHMQAAWYLDLFRDLGADVEAFAFIVQEKEPPYLVEVIELDERAVDRGRVLNARALERYRDCRASGVWPGYSGRDDQSTTVDLPPWAYRDED